MYLMRERHIGPADRTNTYVMNNGERIPARRNGADSDVYTCVDDLVSLRFEAGYWRKANAIHRWFVENVQHGEDNGARYWVSRGELRKLLDTVNEVLADMSKAPQLLPTRSGFFFGSVEYDDYYRKDLELTKEIVEHALAHEQDEFYYHSSW